MGDVDGHLRLIDQTLLPTEYKRIDCRTVEDVWHAIKRLSVRGAPAIGIAAAYGVVIAMQSFSGESATEYREALRLRPNYAQAWLNFGNALARQGQYREAADAFRQAWAIEPNLTSAGLNLGAAQRYLGNWREAVRVWRHGARLAPGHPGIALELALAYLIGADATIHDPAEGLRYARAATEAEPTAHQPVTALAVGLLLNDQVDEAIANARLAEQLGADVPTCLLIMALARHASGDTQLAEEIYQRARFALARQPRGDRVRAALVEKSASVFVANPP